GGDVVAAGGANGGGVAALDQNVLKGLQRLRLHPLVIGKRKGIEGNQVDLDRNVAQQLGQLAGVLRLIVHAVDQGVFHRDLAVIVRHALDVALGGSQQPGNGIFLVDGHQLVAQLVIGRVQGN